MSTTDGEKIRAIREAEDMGRQEFSDLTGIKKQTLISTEQGRMACSLKTVKQVLSVFPKYTMWLVNDQVLEEAGQVSPEIEKARKAFKPTGTDTE
ncbi:helix-turn-helix transcriptional regulator [Modicisalibacter radicis]|uniref:helix-turn-helix transcriptional regulator n=1 Tax=Halomonas sp. EAR18 TaxID=2518972 RepID=UPI00109D0F6B|nr:helix-turn-helix transcriptional regulator [Halomonas sp. EAR18]